MSWPRYVLPIAAAALVLTACGSEDDDPRASSDDAVDVVSGYPAGSSGDAGVEALVDAVQPALEGKGSWIVEAGDGSGGLSEVVDADSDGSTVGVAPLTDLTLRTQLSETAYGIEDFEPIALTSSQPVVLAVAKDASYDALRDFVAISKELTAKVASTGPETAAGIDASLFAKQSGADLVQKRFDRDQQALRSLVGGKTDAAVTTAAAAMPFEQSGDIRVLGVFAEKPIDALPGAPTMRSRGYDIAFGVDNVVLAPKGASADVVGTMRDAFEQAADSDEYRDFLAKNGYAPKSLTGQALRSYIDKQYAQYEKSIEKVDLSP